MKVRVRMRVRVRVRVRVRLRLRLKVRLTRSLLSGLNPLAEFLEAEVAALVHVDLVKVGRAAVGEPLEGCPRRACPAHTTDGCLPLLAARSVIRRDLDNAERVGAATADVDQLREDLVPAGGRRRRVRYLRRRRWARTVAGLSGYRVA